MPGTILVTGASGFVGRALIAELLARGYCVHALVHNYAPPLQNPLLRTFPGGLFDPSSLDAALNGCDAAIHLVGIIREIPRKGITYDRIHYEGTRRIVDAICRAGIRRYLHMSALGTRPDAPSSYHRTKYQAEQYVRTSPLDWTIFRPSLIHGPGGELMQMESRWARRRAAPFLFMPYFAPGLLGLQPPGCVQPIFVNDVARAIADALILPDAIHQTYDLCGPESFTWPEFHRACANALVGHPRWTAPIPAWLATLLTRLLPASLLPFNRDQVAMSLEDNSCPAGSTNHFTRNSTPLRTALAAYASPKSKS